MTRAVTYVCIIETHDGVSPEAVPLAAADLEAARAEALARLRRESGPVAAHLFSGHDRVATILAEAGDPAPGPTPGPGPDSRPSA